MTSFSFMARDFVYKLSCASAVNHHDSDGLNSLGVTVQSKNKYLKILKDPLW